MDFAIELAKYKKAQEDATANDVKAKARRDFKASFCAFGSECRRHKDLTCSWAHGKSKEDLEFCLCTAWWCLKSHLNRSGNTIPECSTIRNPPKGYVCKRCQTTGHFIQDCPYNVCHYCQDTGHIASKCPRRIHYYKRKREES